MARSNTGCQYCGDPVKYPTLTLCGACYEALRYWAKKTVGQRLKRMNRLQVFGARLEDMLGVTPIRKARRR